MLKHNLQGLTENRLYITKRNDVVDVHFVQEFLTKILIPVAVRSCCINIKSIDDHVEKPAATTPYASDMTIASRVDTINTATAPLSNSADNKA